MSRRDHGQPVFSDPDVVCITCGGRGGVISSWLFSILGAGLAGYAAYRMTRGPLDWTRDGPILAIFLIVFPVLAGLFLLHTIWETLRWRKHGESSLHVPLSCGRGGPFRGAVRSARPLETTGSAKLTLSRMETRHTRHAGKSRTHTRVAWSETQEVAPAAVQSGFAEQTGRRAASARVSGQQGTVFPFQFDVPAEAREANGAGAGIRVAWTLTIAAPTRGVNYLASFDVPGNLIQNLSPSGDDDDIEDGAADASDDDGGSDDE